MRIVLEGRRGLGGGGATFEEAIGVEDVVGGLSLDGLRRADGFFGGGGAALPMLELVEVRRTSFGASLSD